MTGEFIPANELEEFLLTLTGCASPESHRECVESPAAVLQRGILCQGCRSGWVPWLPETDGEVKVHRRRDHQNHEYLDPIPPCPR